MKLSQRVTNLDAPQWESPEDYLDQPLLLKGVNVRKGNFGKFAVLDVETIDAIDVQISTGSGQVMNVIAQLVNEEGAWVALDGEEIEFKFTKKGRAILMEDTDGPAAGEIPF